MAGKKPIEPIPEPIESIPISINDFDLPNTGLPTKSQVVYTGPLVITSNDPNVEIVKRNK